MVNLISMSDGATIKMTVNNETKTLVITGGAGMLGSAILDRLVDRYRILVLDVKEPDDPLPGNADYINVDLTSDESVKDAIDDVDQKRTGAIASVIHLAAYYDFSGEPSPLYQQVTVQGTRRMLQQLQRLPVEQFVVSGTMLVHAPTKPRQPITEDHPLEAKWDYPQSKIDTENVIREHHGDIPFVILRIAGVYTDECNSIPLSTQIQRIYEETMTGHVFPGDVGRGQAFLHLSDLLDAVEKTVERRGELAREEILLIGEPETYSYARLQREIAGLIHGDQGWLTTEIPKSVAKTGAWVQGKIPGVEEPFIKPWMIDIADDHYEIDISRARERLGWEPVHRVVDALPKMIASLRRDPDAWYERHGLEKPSEPIGADGARSHES
jgi:nucleoside-diphosphate-sugar epimerase